MRFFPFLRFSLIGSLSVVFPRGHRQLQTSETRHAQSSLPSGSLDLTRAGDDHEPLINDGCNDATMLLQTHSGQPTEPQPLFHVNNSTRVTGQSQIPVTNGSLFVGNQTLNVSSGSALSLVHGNTSGFNFDELVTFSCARWTFGANALNAATRLAKVLDRRIVSAIFLVFLCILLCPMICRMLDSNPSTTGDCAQSVPSLLRSNNALSCRTAGLGTLTAMSESMTEASGGGVLQHPSSKETFSRTSTIPPIATRMPIRVPAWLHDDLVVPSDRKCLVVLPEDLDFQTNSFTPVRNRAGSLVFTIKMEQHEVTQQRRLVLKDGLGSSAFGFYTFEALSECVTWLHNQAGDIIGELRWRQTSTPHPLPSYTVKTLSGSTLIFARKSTVDLSVTEANQSDVRACVQPDSDGSPKRSVTIGPGMDAGLIILSVVCIEWLSYKG